MSQLTPSSIFYRSPESRGRLILEFPVPVGILIIPITPCILPCHPLSSIHISCTPLCSYYPLSISLVFPCLRLSSPVHLLSPQVFSCHSLHMPLSSLLSSSSPVWSLPAQWSVWCLLYIRIFAVKKSWNLNHPYRILKISNYFCNKIITLIFSNVFKVLQLN